VTDKPTQASYERWQVAEQRLEKALQDADKALAKAQTAIGVFKAYTVGREELDQHEAEELARIAKIPRK